MKGKQQAMEGEDLGDQVEETWQESAGDGNWPEEQWQWEEVGGTWRARSFVPAEGSAGQELVHHAVRLGVQPELHS